MAANSPEYNRIYNKAWYAKNKEVRKKEIWARRDTVVRWFRDYRRTQKCARCPENHEATLDFHHIEGKKIELTVAANRGWSIESLKKEIAKCIVLCSNCHRKEHHTARSASGRPSLSGSEELGSNPRCATPESSSGRTVAFEAKKRGSNPCSGTSCVSTKTEDWPSGLRRLS